MDPLCWIGLTETWPVETNQSATGNRRIMKTICICHQKLIGYITNRQDYIETTQCFSEIGIDSLSSVNSFLRIM